MRKATKCARGPSRNIKARSYRNFDVSEFLEDLNQIPWCTIEVADNPDMAWNIFEGLFVPICDKHAPFKNMKIPNKPPPWFDDDYLSLRRDLDFIKSRAQKSKLATDWGAYRAARNKSNNLAKKVKRDYFEAAIKDAGTDSRKLWKTVKTIIPSSQHNPIRSIRVGETITNDGDVIANQFNDFFSNIGKKLADAIPTNQACGVAVPGTNQFHFSGVTVDEISKLLSKLDGRKATGLDNISPISCSRLVTCTWLNH